MRVVFACLPAFGHLQPMVPLAGACMAAGHDVLVATGPDMVERVQAMGMAAVSVGPSRAEGERLAERGGASDDDAPMRRVWDQYVYVHHFPTVGARLRAQDLVPLVADYRPDLVIHDVADFAAPFAAATVDAPSALHSWGPPLNGKTMRRAGRKTEPMWAEAGLVAPTAGGMFRGLYLDISPAALWPDDAPDIPLSQALRPESAREGWLDVPAEVDALPYEKTLHLTLGTVANRSIGTFRTVLGAVQDMGINVVVTVGPDRDPSILGEWPAHILVAPYIPIDPLLERCDAVVDHGGSGTMLAALRHGLPQVIVPYDGDNVRNARLCEKAGVAVQLPLHELDTDMVRTAVQRVLDATEMTAAAARVEAEIASMPSPAEVVPALEKFAAAAV